MAESARLIEGVILGVIALGICVIAVAFIGALMLTGRLPLREVARVVVGSFVPLGAQVIAAGFVRAGEDTADGLAPLPPMAARS